MLVFPLSGAHPERGAALFDEELDREVYKKSKITTLQTNAIKFDSITLVD